MNNESLNGRYIGRHIEYFSHQDLINSIINDLNLDADYSRKVLTGDLISDDTISVRIDWTSNGYSAEFERIGQPESRQVFRIGVEELLGPDISTMFIQSDQPIPELLFHPRPYWMRFKVLNDEKKPVRFLLELDKHLFEYINIYVPGEDGYEVLRETFTTPLDQREIQHKHFVHRLSANPGETTFYAFINSWNKQSKESVPFRIWSENNFMRQSSNDGILSGIVVGLFLFVFLYNLFIYFSVRDPSYLFLSVVTLCQLMLEISSSGIGFVYLWPGMPLLTWPMLYINTSLVMGFNLLFYRSFISIYRYTPRLDKLILFTSWIFFGLALVIFIIPRSLFPGMLWFVFSADHFYTILVLAPTILALKNKNHSGVFALIAIIFYYLGLIKFGLTDTELIQYRLIKYLPIKGLSFLIIMTLGLAHKLNSMQNSLIDLNINLERRVIERTEKLQQANEKLKELDQLKNRFFANISHEFRTPLTLIIEPLKALQQGTFGRIPKKGLETLSSMRRNADRLFKLISDYLDLSKLEVGKMDLRKECCNIPKLLLLFISSFESSAAVKGIDIEFENKNGDFQAYVDVDLLEKVVFNLLSNAIKFNRPEGENKILVTLDTDADNFRISIKDSGIGIPEEQLASIFDRFSQVDSSNTRRHEGTGIGLSLTQEIVDLHEGEIHVESKPKVGTTFIVTIPLAIGDDEQNSISGTCTSVQQKDEDSSIRRADPPNKFTKSVDAIKEPVNLIRDVSSEEMTILVVEDNADMRQFLRDTLGKSYHTIAVSNGKEALEILESETVDLVLTDLMMPEMDGFELTESIRSQIENEGLPIILLTARSDIPDKIQGFEKGANDYIIKPFSSDEVMSRIASQLKFKLLRDKLIEANRNLKGKRKVLTDSTVIRIEAVKDFLNNNFTEDFIRDDLAAMAKMSPDHLGKMFKQYTGVKISDYVNRKRIEEASRQLSETKRKIVDIAFDVGFGSLRSFNLVFRDITGYSPSGYRKKHRTMNQPQPSMEKISRK